MFYPSKPILAELALLPVISPTSTHLTAETTLGVDGFFFWGKTINAPFVP
jgi:hypothetical protein